MPDNEKIQYSYDLDISSLQKGTEKAIKLLQSQIDSLTGVTRQTKSAASSAKVFEKAWLKASNKVAGAQDKINKAMESAQREADKYLAREASQKSPKYVPTNIQKQIEDLVGVGTKAKSAEASAKAFEKAWLNASDKVSQKNSKTTKSVEQVAQAVDSGATYAQKAFARLSQVVGNLKAPLQQAFEPITTKLGVMANMIDPNISSKVQSFRDKAKNAFENVSGVLRQVSSAFRRTSNSADDNASSASKVATRMERFNSACTKTFNNLNKLNSGVQNASKFFDKCSTKLRNFTSALNGASKSTNVLRTAIKVLTAERIAEYLKNGIKQSISYVENLNLFTVAMGKSIDKGNEFVDIMQELYGMDPSNIMRYAGNFYQLATAIEMPDEAAAQLSLTMTKAVNDISSLFNVDIETVFENMSSGLQGMSRAVRKYGMDIRTTTLQTEALALGITDQVESMSEANRIGLRFIAMMKQASNATGDFAANIETPANQMRIFKEQVTQLGRAISDFFIAPLRNALQYINGFIMAIRSVLVFIRKLLGIEVDFQTRTGGLSDDLDSTSSGISGIGDAASDTTKKLKGMLAPFDELNVLTRDTASASSGGIGIGRDIMDPRIAKAIQDIEYKFEDIEMKANKVRNALLEFFGFKVDSGEILDWDPSQFEDNLINKFPQWTKTIQATFDNWTTITESFKSVFRSLGDVFAEAWKKYKDTFATIVNDEAVANFIDGFTDKLSNFSDWVKDNQDTLSSIAEKIMWLVTAFLALKAASPVLTLIANGFSLLSKGASILSSGITGVSNVLSFLPKVLSAVTSPIGLVITAVALLAATSEDFRKSLGNIVTSLFILLQSLLKPIIKLLGTILDKLLPPLLDIIGSIGDVLAPVIDLLAEVIESLAPIVSEVIGLITDVLGDFISSLQGVFEGVATFVQGIAQIVRGVTDIVAGILSGDFKRIGNGLLGIFTGVLNAISGVVESVINLVITALNSAISLIWRLLMGGINSLLSGVEDILSWVGVNVSLQVNWSAPQIPTISIPRISAPGFEDGGFPERGTYFRALENGFGSEMVGTMGGRTAVANNEQIERGIAQAVLEALMQTGLIGYVRSIDQNTRETAEKDFTLGNPSVTAGRWIKQSTDAYDKVRG